MAPLKDCFVNYDFAVLEPTAHSEAAVGELMNVRDWMQPNKNLLHKMRLPGPQLSTVETAESVTGANRVMALCIGVTSWEVLARDHISLSDRAAISLLGPARAATIRVVYKADFTRDEAANPTPYALLNPNEQGLCEAYPIKEDQIYWPRQLRQDEDQLRHQRERWPELVTAAYRNDAMGSLSRRRRLLNLGAIGRAEDLVTIEELRDITNVIQCLKKFSSTESAIIVFLEHYNDYATFFVGESRYQRAEVMAAFNSESTALNAYEMFKVLN